MDKFKLVVDKNALADIQEVTDWYNLQSKGLGSRFQKQAKSHISKLKRNAGNYGVRYANVRCMLIKKIPFLVHFVLDKQNFVVEVFAVIHTSRNPKEWDIE